VRKLYNFLLLLLPLALLQTGCVFPTGCGLFGYSSSYRGELILDDPFEPARVNVKDTLIIRPSNHLHIDYTYTGNPDCENAQDYVSGPDMVTANVQEDSLATVNVFTEGRDEWGGNEEKVQIIGEEVGKTSLLLTIHWTVEGNQYYQDIDSTFTVGLTIQD
jgi:hypothetical protein